MKYMYNLNFNCANITYSYFNKTISVMTKNTLSNKKKSEYVINFKKILFLTKNEENIKKLNQYDLIVESTEIFHCNDDKLLIVPKLNVIVDYIDEISKNRKIVKKIYVYKIINIHNKLKNLKVFYSIKNISKIDDNKILVSLSIKLCFS